MHEIGKCLYVYVSVCVVQYATKSNDDYGNGNRCAVCVLHAEINDRTLVRTVQKKRILIFKKKVKNRIS